MTLMTSRNIVIPTGASLFQREREAVEGPCVPAEVEASLDSL